MQLCFRVDLLNSRQVWHLQVKILHPLVYLLIYKIQTACFRVRQLLEKHTKPNGQIMFPTSNFKPLNDSQGWTFWASILFFFSFIIYSEKLNVLVYVYVHSNYSFSTLDLFLQSQRLILYICVYILNILIGWHQCGNPL